MPKPGRFSATGAVLLRVIMNLKPINRILDIIKGNIDELPMATTWTQLCLEEDEAIHIFQTDMSSAFYLFEMPAGWRPFMAFDARVPGEALGFTAGEVFVPSCRVLPISGAHADGEPGTDPAIGYSGGLRAQTAN